MAKKSSKKKSATTRSAKAAKPAGKKKSAKKKASKKKSAKKKASKKKSAKKKAAESMKKKSTAKSSKKQASTKQADDTEAKPTNNKKKSSRTSKSKAGDNHKAVNSPMNADAVMRSVSGVGGGSGITLPDEPPTEAELKKVKTGLTRKELSYFRELLLERRAEILGDVESLQGDVENRSGGNLSSLPFHMADVGSDNYEHEFTLGLLEHERKMLREIDEALVRMERGYFGVCVESAQPISRERLEFKPWAKYCIEVAREKERLGQS